MNVEQATMLQRLDYIAQKSQRVKPYKLAKVSILLKQDVLILEWRKDLSSPNVGAGAEAEA